MAIPGGLLTAAAIGIAGAVGVSWWMKRNAPAAPKSACEKACLGAAGIAGATGDLDALCKGSCGAVSGLLDAARDIFNPCPDGSKLDKSTRPGVADHRGGTSNAPDFKAPPGFDQAMYDKLAHEVGPRGLVKGSCRDEKTAEVVGYIAGTPPKFYAWRPSSSSAPPVVPQPDPTKPSTRPPSRGPRGGVGVTPS